MPTASDSHSTWSFRLGVVCLVAVAVSLPMAWISLSKALLFVSGAAYVLVGRFGQAVYEPLHGLRLPRIVLLALSVFAISLWWTAVDLEFALSIFVKHSKLLTILLLISLIRTPREARYSIYAFAAGQLFVLVCSWLLGMGASLPWVMNDQDQNTRYVVFAESYLDQSLMFSILAVVFWHLSKENLWPRWVGLLVAAGAILNILILLPGRTGYVVVIAMLTLALMWAMPARRRLLVLVVAPLLIGMGLYLLSGQIRDRVNRVVSETQSFATQEQNQTPLERNSSAWRLNAWRLSLMAIEQQPWRGHGVGSWAPAIKQFQPESATQIFGKTHSSNPHQEYLLWGVELGIGGILLLLALLISAASDARSFQHGPYRASLSIVLTIALACLFNSSLLDDLMGDFLCVSLGLLLAYGLRTSQAQMTASRTD